DDFGEFFLALVQLNQSLGNDRRRGDHEDASQINAVRFAPAKELTDLVTGEKHQSRLQRRDDESGGPDLANLTKVELEAESEEQEDQAEFRQRVNGLLICDQWEGQGVRSNQNSRQDVADDDGQFEKMEGDGDQPG